MTQPARFGEMSLLRWRYARQVIKIRRKPAGVLREKFRDEVSRRVRTRSDQFFPSGPRGCSPRHNHSPRSNAEVAGGAAAGPAWKELVGAGPDSPGDFIPKLF